MAPCARRFTDPALGTVPITDIEPTTRSALDSRLARHRVITFDLTTEDVLETPLRVARVLVSGLIPNQPAAFAYLGCPRFAQQALSRQWRTSAPTTAADFTLAPPPHM
jgi:ribosomal protein S12 methylthiotransferase accessory factor